MSGVNFNVCLFFLLFFTQKYTTLLIINARIVPTIINSHQLFVNVYLTEHMFQQVLSTFPHIQLAPFPVHIFHLSCIVYIVCISSCLKECSSTLRLLCFVHIYRDNAVLATITNWVLRSVLKVKLYIYMIVEHDCAQGGRRARASIRVLFLYILFAW